MTLTQTEIVGYGKNMIALLTKEDAVLEKAGVRAKEFRVVLEQKIEKATLANARQEELKRQTREATEEVTAAMEDLYRTASGYLDAAMGAVGKGTETPKNFQRLRSRVRDPDLGGSDPTPVEPNPGAAR